MHFHIDGKCRKLFFRTLSCGPKHRQRCRCCLKLVLNNSQQDSLVSILPERSTDGLIRSIIMFSSWCEKIAEASPVDRNDSKGMKKDSSITLELVSIRTAEIVSIPHLRIICFRYVSKSVCENISAFLTTCALQISYPQIKALSFAKLSLPMPSIPTRRACPNGLSIILVILQICATNCSNMTKFIAGLTTLYSTNLSSMILTSFAWSVTRQ